MTPKNIMFGHYECNTYNAKKKTPMKHNPKNFTQK